VMISLRHQPESAEVPCGVCGSLFVAAEDSGSRVLGLKSAAQEFSFLMCGGFTPNGRTAPPFGSVR
jgi:hypothetical protein